MPVLNIDVGGQKFRVLRETVMKYANSLLAQVITGKDIYHMIVIDGCYFFDRNPQYFSVILDHMRIGKLFLPPNLLQDQLQEELKFWKIDIDNVNVNKNNIRNEIEPTLVISENIESTLVISEELPATLLANPIIEPTMLINSPKIEPTLIIQDPPNMEINHKNKEEPLKNSIKTFRATTSSQFEVKKEVKKIILDEDDELLTSLLPENTTNRTLPWGNKDIKKPVIAKDNTDDIKKNLVNNKLNVNQIKVNQQQIKKGKIKEESENEIGYESSFIDDDLSLSDDDFKPKKRKQVNNPPPQKKLKTVANRPKKNIIPKAEELENALKHMR